MESKLSKLGFFIEEYNEINKNGEFKSIDDLQGINSEKYFQECKSNKNDIELNRYRICRRGMFSYNKATSRNGEKISIALRKGPDCLVSPSYYCFKIKDESILNPDYLMLWFSRPVFDRYVRFNSWGSATEFFTFESMCEVPILVPSIDEQKRIVDDFNGLTERINSLRSRDKHLRNLAKIYLKNVIDTVELSEFKLTDVADTLNGYSYSSDELIDSNIGMATIKNFELEGGYKIDGYKSIKPIKKVRDLQLFDIVIACTDLTPDGAVIGNVEMVLDFGDFDRIIPSMDLVTIKPKNIEPFLLIMLLKHYYTKDVVLSYTKGTTVLHLDKDIFEKETLMVPTSEKIRSDLSAKFKSIFNALSLSLKEQNALEKAKKLLLSKM